MDETFVYGFSHGSTGDKLKGKKRIFTSTKTIRKFMLNAMVWLFNYKNLKNRTFLNRF